MLGVGDWLAADGASGRTRVNAMSTNARSNAAEMPLATTITIKIITTTRVIATTTSAATIMT